MGGELTADRLLVTRIMLLCGLLSSTMLHAFPSSTQNRQVNTVEFLGCWRPHEQVQATSRCPRICAPELTEI